MNDKYIIDSEIKAEIWAAKTIAEEMHKKYMNTTIWDKESPKYKAAVGKWFNECERLQQVLNNVKERKANKA